MGGSTARETSFVNPEQQKKAHGPMEVTELGMVKEVSPEQQRKTSPPIEVTELGIVADFRPEQ